MTDKYAVVGNPVVHSKSPFIHAEFARQTGHDISYAPVLAPRDGFAEVVLGFRDAGGCGMNVTLPFKHEAWSLATRREGFAEAAGAVNTLAFRAREIVGYNTDGVGLVRDIQHNLGCAIAARRVLLMGAGGAAYGVLEPLMRERPARLVISNRTPDKAEALAAHFRGLAQFAAHGMDGCGYSALDEPFDILINATSAGLDDEMPEVPGTSVAPGALAYDMVYGRATPFLEFARARGARISDGTGMLVEQAAESFFVWRGVRPQTAPVIAKLRKRD